MHISMGICSIPRFLTATFKNVYFPTKVSELATVKRPQERSYMLQRWQEDGGVMIIGYEMYRNLAQGRNVKSRKLKEIFNKALVDPGNTLTGTEINKQVE